MSWDDASLQCNFVSKCRHIRLRLWHEASGHSAFMNTESDLSAKQWHCHCWAKLKKKMEICRMKGHAHLGDAQTNELDKNSNFFVMADGLRSFIALFLMPLPRGERVSHLPHNFFHLLRTVFVSRVARLFRDIWKYWVNQRHPIYCKSWIVHPMFGVASAREPASKNHVAT